MLIRLFTAISRKDVIVNGRYWNCKEVWGSGSTHILLLGPEGAELGFRLCAFFTWAKGAELRFRLCLLFCYVWSCHNVWYT